MFRWNSKQRGQAGLLVLVMVAWLSLLAMGHYQATLIMVRAGGFNQQMRARLMSQHNALTEQLIVGEAGRGRGEHGELSFRRHEQRAAGVWLRSRLVRLQFEDREGWPEVAALLVEGERYHVLIKDYQRRR